MIEFPRKYFLKVEIDETEIGSDATIQIPMKYKDEFEKVLDQYKRTWVRRWDLEHGRYYIFISRAYEIDNAGLEDALRQIIEEILAPEPEIDREVWSIEGEN